jgi:hypothetical protein
VFIYAFIWHSSRGLNPQRWLDAFNDSNASIYTFSRCMTFADINADGDYKLIITDLGTGTTNIKLKVQIYVCVYIYIYYIFYIVCILSSV